MRVLQLNLNSIHTFESKVYTHPKNVWSSKLGFHFKTLHLFILGILFCFLWSYTFKKGSCFNVMLFDSQLCLWEVLHLQECFNVVFLTCYVSVWRCRHTPAPPAVPARRVPPVLITGRCLVCRTEPLLRWWSSDQKRYGIWTLVILVIK